MPLSVWMGIQKASYEHLTIILNVRVPCLKRYYNVVELSLTVKHSSCNFVRKMTVSCFLNICAEYQLILQIYNPQ
jgi:hypothetical protein